MYTHLQERFAPRPPVNISTLNKMKVDGHKIACVTAYDASFAALVLYDLLDITAGRKPRFAKNFMAGVDTPLQALKNYAEAVRDKSYPAPEHCFGTLSAALEAPTAATHPNSSMSVPTK